MSIIEFKLIHVDEFVDELLIGETACDTALPRITKRQVLEENGTLKPRESTLEELEEEDETLLAEATENGNGNKNGMIAGDDELIENPRAEALRPDRRRSEERDRKKRRDEEDDQERRRRKEKKREKKEKKEKKKKYRTRGSVSRSRSKSKSKSEKSESGSRSRSRSRSEKKKKKKSKWKKHLKEKRKDKNRSRSKSRSKSEDKDRRNKRKDSGEDNGGKLDENSDEYWIAMRAKAGLKPI